MVAEQRDVEAIFSEALKRERERPSVPAIWTAPAAATPLCARGLKRCCKPTTSPTRFSVLRQPTWKLRPLTRTWL